MAAARLIPDAPTALPFLPDEILEDIFLRLDAAADLARTSVACSSFRRLICARRFLRRFRSIHTPPVLGLLSDGGYGVPRFPVQGFIHIDPPHRCAPAARALVRAADFTFSFLPDASSWRPRDSRDGRVVLSRRVANAAAFDDLVVCDPLHRRYVMIPPIPDDLTASITKLGKHFEPSLTPSGDGEDEKLKEEEELSFKVICTVRSENKFIAFFFSWANQKWGLITYHSSSSFRYRRCYVHGCFFWVVDSNRYTLMLDTREMKFSIIDLPANNDEIDDALEQTVIVEAGQDKLGFLTIGGSNEDRFCKIWRNNGLGAEGWQHYKMIPLPKDSDGLNYRWVIVDVAEHYVNLIARKRVPGHGGPHLRYFVLDTETLLFERLCALNGGLFLGRLYGSFPPPLALPSI